MTPRGCLWDKRVTSSRRPEEPPGGDVSLRCPSCGHSNRADRRYCAACGSHLGQACPSCGTRNNLEEKFCGACGAALSGAAAEGERRQLTVLFCDLVSSTELSARLDPEDFRDVVRAYQRSAEEVVSRFGGHVGKYLGDGLLVYFGWPRAREDDAERAVRAGLALLGAVSTLNESLTPGVRLAVRVGMHTGPVVVAEDGEVFGETPNVAARVQVMAEPDTVVVTAATHRLVAGLFLVEDRGARDLKGLPAPLRLYRVVRPSGVRGRLAAAALRGLTPFVGRERERQTLAEAWERAREGEGQVVLVIGEAGIGKSRLVQEFKVDLAATPHTWIEGGGAAYYQTTPFHVVVDLLQQGSGRAADLPAEARLDALDQALAVVGLKPATATPLVAPLLDLALPEGRYPPLFVSTEQQRKQLLATLATWATGAARLQATVGVVEDLHWVDPSTLDLLGLLVEQGATVPLLLVLTARPEFRAPWPVRAHHAQVNLNRLTKRQVREMIASVTTQVVPAEAVVETLVARTDGVPLFVEELTRAVAEGAAGSMAERTIPTTLQDTLMARLDRLAAAKEVAQTAAVLGREFSYVLLQAVSPLADDALQAALGKLAAADLLYARGLPPEATYLFKHALIQDAAYESLLRSRRRELHLTVAEALTGRLADVPEAQPEVVAQHWEAAGEGERAVAAWQQAGERAKDRGAAVEAERHYKRALGVLATLPDGPARVAQELALHIPLALVLHVTHGFASPETAQSNARVRELSAQLGDTQQLLMALILAYASTYTRGELRAARALAEELLDAARRDGSTFALTWGHYVAGNTRYMMGELPAAGEHAAEALQFYREEDHRSWPSEAGTLAHAGLACVQAQQGLVDHALAESGRLLALTERLESPSQQALGYLAATGVDACLRDAEGVLTKAERLLALTVEHELAIYVGWGHVYHGWALAVLGRTDEGIAELRQGLAGYAALGQRAALGWYLGFLAEAQLLAGQMTDGLATIEQALAAVPEERIYIPELLRLRGEFRAAAGADAATVEVDFREAIVVARQMGAKLQELRVATSLARYLDQHERTVQARDLLAPLYASFTEGFETRDLVEAKALLEELG